MGGRIATFRKNGAKAELGAAVVEGGAGNPVGVLAQQLGVELAKVRLKCPLVDVGGKPVPRARAERVGKEWERLLAGQFMFCFALATRFYPLM